jgi:hypothetical protein
MNGAACCAYLVSSEPDRVSTLLIETALSDLARQNSGCS